MLRSILIISLLSGCSNFFVEIEVVGDVQNILATDPNQNPHTIRLSTGRLAILGANVEGGKNIKGDINIRNVGDGFTFDFVAAQKQFLGEAFIRPKRVELLDLLLATGSADTDGHMLKLAGTVTLSDASEVPFTALVDTTTLGFKDFFLAPIPADELDLTLQIDLASLLSGIDYDLLAAGTNEIQILPGSQEEVTLRENFFQALKLVNSE